MGIQSYKDLVVWNKSMELAKMIYSLSKELPKDEQYGLVSQIRRCAVSIPSNIAEGQKRRNIGEYMQFLYIAGASAAELETQLLIIKDVYPKVEVSTEMGLLTEIEKMLAVLVRNLRPKA